MKSLLQPSNPDVSIAEGFALMLETACEDFEIMRRLIRQETVLISSSGNNDYRTIPRIQMALAKSFVFHVVRARRICEHGAGSLKIDSTERKLFLKATACVISVRDVNEHGFDAGSTLRGKISKPSFHHHTKVGAILDETAMVIHGDQAILMGPLNLYEIYIPTDRMRKLAGFTSLNCLADSTS